MAIVIFDVSGTLHEDVWGAPMYDEFFEVFDSLKKHNIQIALATNLSRAGLNQFIKKNNLEDYLSEHLSISEVSPKPSSEMLEEILLRTGEANSNALMVGDSTNDIISAKNAHIKVCAVNWKGIHSENILNHNPEYKVEKIVDLWQVFVKVFKIK